MWMFNECLSWRRTDVRIVNFAPVRYFFDDDKRGVTSFDEHRFAQCRLQMFG